MRYGTSSVYACALLPTLNLLNCCGHCSLRVCLKCASGERESCLSTLSPSSSATRGEDATCPPIHHSAMAASSRSAVRAVAREAVQSLRQRSLQQASRRGISAVAAAHEGPVDGFSAAVGNTPLVSISVSSLMTAMT